MNQSTGTPTNITPQMDAKMRSGQVANRTISYALIVLARWRKDGVAEASGLAIVGSGQLAVLDAIEAILREGQQQLNAYYYPSVAIAEHGIARDARRLAVAIIVADGQGDDASAATGSGERR